MDFCGLLTFPKDLLCRKEVLGENFDAVISGVKVKVCFPCYPKDITSSDDYIHKDYTLEPPKCRVLKRGEDQIEWGRLTSYPACNARVASVMILIDCKEDIEENAKKLYSSIKVWGKKLIDYCDLCVKDLSINTRSPDSNTCRLELVYEKYIPSFGTTHLIIPFIKDEDCLTKNQVIDALIFASSNEEISLEYQMLLSAYKARTERQYRQAIVDACSAVEICLNKQIEEYCRKIGLDSEILFKKYRSLGDKFTLIKKIDENFNVTNPFDRIVSPRNRVVHKNEFPDAETTWELLNAVEECLKQYNVDYY